MRLAGTWPRNTPDPASRRRQFSRCTRPRDGLRQCHVQRQMVRQVVPVIEAWIVSEVDVQIIRNNKMINDWFWVGKLITVREINLWNLCFHEPTWTEWNFDMSVFRSPPNTTWSMLEYSSKMVAMSLSSSMNNAQKKCTYRRKIVFDIRIRWTLHSKPKLRR